MDDSGSAKVSLQTVWYRLGRRLTAASGASGALVALWSDVPLPEAALRGAAIALVVAAVWKLGQLALEKALEADARESGGDEAVP